MRLAREQFDEWFKTEEGAKELDDAQYYGSTIRQSFDGVEYIYNPVNGTASLYEEPGCTTVFDVYLTDGLPNTLTCIKVTALRYRLRI